MNRLFALLLLAVFWLSPARAQTYNFDDSAAAALAYPWIDISTTGTQIGLADDQVSSNLDMGFTFTFGASAYTRVRIASNGMLMFGGTSTEYVNTELPFTGNGAEPNIDAVMVPLFDDYQPDGLGTFIRYRAMGTAPNRVFVVTWLAIPYYCWNRNGSGCDNDNQTTGAFATFQVQIYEQGQFVYRYGSVNGAGGTHSTGATFTNPGGGTVGYELNDTDFVQYSYRSASVPSGRTVLWTRTGTAPGSFNAFDTSTASGSIVGNIHTKVAGSAFNLAVVALNSTKTAVATTFTGDVKVELLNASDNSGTLNASTGCRSTWTTALQTQTTTFAGTDLGRDTVTFTEPNAWKDVRVRMSYPATGTATVVACSTDDFAIRPSSFANFAATDADWATAGTARSLANAAATGGNVHKAGQPFTISATAVNASSVTTTNYTLAPTATISACSGTACTSGFGTLTVSLTAAAGVINNTTASYSEVGAFALQLNDTSFASVDGADGSTASELTISSPTITVGRFVPDHFDVTTLVTPVLKTFNTTTCSTRSFTYVGQPFGYTTAPQATVLARNAAGTTTANYSGAMWKLVTGGISQAYSPLSPASPGLDVSGATTPSLTSNSNGTGVLATSSSDLLKFTRSPTTPLAPFSAAISLTWGVSDTSESAVTGNGTIATTAPLTFSSIAFDAGNAFRYGILKLASAYGSELTNLPVPVEAQYWDGARFATNTSDQCTSLPTVIMAMGNYQRNLTACETGLASATLRLSSGRGYFTLIKPGAGNSGSMDINLQLGATATGSTCVGTGGSATAASAGSLAWLQGKWSGSNYDQNPSARASFGQYKSPLIYLRESF
jgi:MSHA biogenesis protein MshQ